MSQQVIGGAERTTELEWEVKQALSGLAIRHLHGMALHS